MKNLILFCLLILPLGLRAQQPGNVSIPLHKDSLQHEIYTSSRLWRFQPGDDTAWAATNYDDSHWAFAKTGLSMEDSVSQKLGFTSNGWFRLRFSTDSSLINIPIGIEIEQEGASEIYIDGKLLHRYGRFRKDGQAQYLSPKGDPAIFVVSPGNHVLAVRYENADARSRLEKDYSSDAGFTLSFINPSDSFHNYKNVTLLLSVFALISGAVFLTLFFVHFILFLFYRAAVSNLIFSLFNLSFALVCFVSYVGASGERVGLVDFATTMINIALSLSCFSLSALVSNLFSRSRWRLWVVIIWCITVIVLTMLNHEWATSMLAVLGITCAVEAAVMVCIAMYRKVSGARIIGAGILFFVLFFGGTIVVSLSTGGIYLNGGWFALLLVILSVLALFSIPFAMSTYLAWSFAAVNKDLKTQLQQVEMLSEKTRAQEQEKQLMLENRKEELEREVALRTTEVMQQKEKIEQQHDALKAEKKKSDDLLLNILPAEVAEELKETGTTKAQHFDHVSVLFTDFVNFTQISEQLSPEELVQELHECFRAFDEIMERNGMEKIKTIGDAYLAVSGMPVADERHAWCAVCAGLEIVAFIENRSDKRHKFEVRVGVNSGPLVAGIVGVKKFAYDIWGDTVNMASRMESNSESGKVNISENTHALVLNDFTFTYRGKINAKNKGEVDMYFVDGPIADKTI